MKLETMDFKVRRYTGADKEIMIHAHAKGGSNGATIMVDHDDCDHRVAEAMAVAISQLPRLVGALKSAEATFQRYAGGHFIKAQEAAENQNPEASLAYKAKGEANLAEANAIAKVLKLAGVS